jgi:ABC-2 type transporter.
LSNKFTDGLKTVLAISWFNGIVNLKRSPLSVLNFVLTPFSILFFIFIFGGPRATTYGLVGGVISTIVSSSIIIETDAAFIRLILKVQDMFVASPCTPLTYVAGLALSELMNGLPGIVIFLALLTHFNHVGVLGDALIVFSAALTWASISSLGFFISTFARDPRDLWVYSPILTVMLSFLPPVYYPLSVIPNWVRPLAYLAPTTYSAELIRIASGISTGDPALYVAGILAYTFILIYFAGKRMRWREA